MAIRPIRLFGDPILLTEAEPVTDFDRPLRQLVKDLTETLRDAGGAGLAAPQIGVGLTGGRLHGTHRRSRRLPAGHEPMTAVTTTPAGTAAEPRARFRDLLAAEWLEFWSLRSTPWSFVISALVILGLNAGAAYEHDRYWHMNHMSPARFIAEGLPLLDAYTTNAGIAMIVMAGAIGTLAITGEYGTGLIRTTFTAVPARRSVMAAKVSVIAGVTAVFGAVVAACSFGLTQAILSARHAGISFGSPGALRVMVASALLAPVAALTGAAVGAIVRHSAAAVAGTIVILQVLPLFIHDDSHLPAVIAHALPFQAWNRLAAIPFNPVASAYPWTTAGAWTVFAVWAFAAAILAVTAVYRRDV